MSVQDILGSQFPVVASPMNLKAATLQQSIHDSIPISRTLGYHIEELTDESIVVGAPLAPNINIHNAAFAGSLYSVAALTAWALVTHLVNEAQIDAAVVIGKADIIYNQPITEDISCRSCVSTISQGEFVAALQTQKKSKIQISVAIGNRNEATLNAVVFATCTA